MYSPYGDFELLGLILSLLALGYFGWAKGLLTMFFGGALFGLAMFASLSSERDFAEAPAVRPEAPILEQAPARDADHAPEAIAA